MHMQAYNLEIFLQYLCFKKGENFHNQILKVVAKRSEIVANRLAIKDGF